MDKSYWPPGSPPKGEFSWKNFLRSKGAKGLESIFKYVPESMKVSFLKGMHKMHPTQAEEFMRKMFWDDTTSAGWDEWVMDTTEHLWKQDEGGNRKYGLWQGPLKPKDYNVIYDYRPDRASTLRVQELLRRSLREPEGDKATREFIEEMIKYGDSDTGKYDSAVLDQQKKLNQGSMLDDAKKYQIALGQQQRLQQGKYAPLGKVIDFATKKQEMTPKGIPWSKIGMRILNHPITRGVGVAGDVALGGMAYSDVMGGTNFVGDSVRGINEMMGVPYKDDGTVWTNTQDYENFMNPPPPAVGQPGGAPVRRFNRGGIASLV